MTVIYKNELLFKNNAVYDMVKTIYEDWNETNVALAYTNLKVPGYKGRIIYKFDIDRTSKDNLSYDKKIVHKFKDVVNRYRHDGIKCIIEYTNAYLVICHVGKNSMS